MYRTTRNLDLTAWEAIAPHAFTLPKGSAARLVVGLSGTDGDGFAVDSVAQLVELTGNRHDATHRYVVLPADAVEGNTVEERAAVERIAAKEASKPRACPACDALAYSRRTGCSACAYERTHAEYEALNPDAPKVAAKESGE